MVEEVVVIGRSDVSWWVGLTQASDQETFGPGNQASPGGEMDGGAKGAQHIKSINISAWLELDNHKSCGRDRNLFWLP